MTPVPAVTRRVTAVVAVKSLIGALMVRPPELKFWMIRSPPPEPTLRPPVVPEIVKAFVPVTSRPPVVEPKARSNVARLSVCDAAGLEILSVPTKLPVAVKVSPVPLAVAACDRTKVVPLVMLEMVVLAGIPVPLTAMPETRPAVLATVTLVEVLVVTPDVREAAARVWLDPRE